MQKNINKNTNSSRTTTHKNYNTSIGVMQASVRFTAILAMAVMPLRFLALLVATRGQADPRTPPINAAHPGDL